MKERITKQNKKNIRIKCTCKDNIIEKNDKQIQMGINFLIFDCWISIRDFYHTMYFIV